MKHSSGDKPIVITTNKTQKTKAKNKQPQSIKLCLGLGLVKRHFD